MFVPEPRREGRCGAAARPSCGGWLCCSLLWITSLTLPREVVGRSQRLASWRCMPRCCFRIVFDSAGSAGVVFGPTLVVGHGITLFPLLCSTL
ncbi:hypothetical protein Taro_040297 [Colocasia esculenta]|uniref:Secreted protein n=1 Tax=Colocasia esculenta TaxID=4460 RepID=A0A843WCV2_COLES|nr:hypothetical protein [Colocasia esculenta]